MLYSPEEKRKIILDNYNHPSKQLELEELKKKSEEWQAPFSEFHSLDQGCGDIIYLLIKKENKHIKECWFSAQQSCLITVAAANILCSYLAGKEIQSACELINNCQAMVESKEYNLDNCPNLQVFSDISQFPHRIECINLVIRGITNTMS